jgi:hypothetical protein
MALELLGRLVIAAAVIVVVLRLFCDFTEQTSVSGSRRH